MSTLLDGSLVVQFVNQYHFKDTRMKQRSITILVVQCSNNIAWIKKKYYVVLGDVMD